MCGIAGIIGVSSGAKVDPSALERMRLAVDDRGPDARGIWRSPDGAVGFAHARLSTMDLSPSATQPLWDAEGRVVVCFNGEIYNHLDLRRELEAEGCVFKTESDAEVLPNGFKVWGAGLLDRIKGQFAFAVHDTVTGRTMLARDRQGISPMYVARHDGRLYFASTVEAVLAGTDMPRALDMQAAHDFFVMDGAGWGRTMVAGVETLRAGFALHLGGGGDARPERFYIPSPQHFTPDASRSEEEWVLAVRDQLLDAGRTCMRGDKEVGVYLSGGIDSIAVQALVKMAYPDLVVNTFSAGYRHSVTGEVVGELEFAGKMARHFGTRHHEIVVSEDDLLASLGTFDLPTESILPTVIRMMAARAAEEGVAVTLSGEGSDELFFGYDHGLAAVGFLNPDFGHLTDRYQLRGKYAEGLDPATAKLVDVFCGGGANIDLDNARAELFGEYGDATRPVRQWIETFLVECLSDVPDMELDKQILSIDFGHKLPENFLRRGEGPSMAQGVEMRFPFLWHDLVDLMSSMPMGVRIGEGVQKHILRKAMTGLLPQEVVDKPKSPFGLPASRKTYFKGSGASFDKPAFEHFFWKNRDAMRAALIEGAWRCEGVFAPGVIEARVEPQMHEDTASFDPFLWKVWSFAAWYDKVLAG